MKRISLLFPLLAALCAQGVRAQVNLEVNVAERGIEVSPNLYGIFYEDINFASDGGLYAELIRNRSFEFSDKAPEHWEALGSNIGLTTEGLLNDRQRHALRVETTKPFGGVANPGFWGINAVQGTQYRLSFWIKCQTGKPGLIKAALTDKSGGEVLAETAIDQKIGKGWQKVETTLTATKSDPMARFTLTMEKPCTVLLDVVSLFPPTFKGRENGCRIDLAEKLQALHPAFMRFPGGCYVEGNFKPENAYHWERTVGPIENRPGHMNANWGYPTTDGLGFHEFLQLCEDLNAKALFVVNIGIWHGGSTPLDSLQPWIDECLGALEYAKGPTSSHYGKMRADNGHPEPFDLAFIEIGNENYNWNTSDNSDQSDHYPERYRMFYDAIKLHYPDVQCIGNVESWGTDTPRWRNSHPVDIVDEHYYRNPGWFVGQYHRFDNYDRKGPIIYPGEYAVTQGFGTTGNMNAALGEAVFMLGMENNSDIVRMSSYAPLFANENKMQWHPDMIRFNSSASFGTPSYWVQQLFPTHIGNRVVKTSLKWNIQRQDTQRDKAVGVGLATWRTNATYRNPQILVEGTTIPLSDVKAWKPGSADASKRGNWTASADGSIRQASNAEGTVVVCPETISARRYTYKVQARKESGDEGFMVVFNYEDGQNYDWFNVGGWSNTRTTVEQTSKNMRSTFGTVRNEHIDSDRWYDLQVDVDGDSITCFVNGDVAFSGRKNDGTLHGVYANSTLDERTGTLYTKLVNLCSSGTKGSLRLAGGAVAAEATMVRLAGATGDDENTMQYPNNIIPRPAAIEKADGGRRLTFDVAPFSVNIITTKLSK